MLTWGASRSDNLQRTSATSAVGLDEKVLPSYEQLSLTRSLRTPLSGADPLKLPDRAKLLAEQRDGLVSGIAPLLVGRGWESPSLIPPFPVGDVLPQRPLVAREVVTFLPRSQSTPPVNRTACRDPAQCGETGAYPLSCSTGEGIRRCVVPHSAR